MTDEHRAGCASEAWDGRPESPECDGWHWFKDRAGALFVAKWYSDGEYYVRHYSDTPYEFAAPNGWAYLGPCLMPDEAAELRAEKDRAQSACTAWRGIFEGIEAHLLDRIAMKDAANPERYLWIIRVDVADVNRSSERICASRWYDAAALRDQRDALEARLKVAEEALEACEEYFDNRADAENDSEGTHPNIEMRLLDVVRAALPLPEPPHG